MLESYRSFSSFPVLIPNIDIEVERCSFLFDAKFSQISYAIVTVVGVGER